MHNTAAQVFFSDAPTAAIPTGNIQTYRYMVSNGILLNIVNANQSNLKITAKHSNGANIFTVDSNGGISP